MLKEFDEFVYFCLKHGGTLRNHKQFGEMAQALRAQIDAAEQPRALDGASVCRQISHLYIDGVCAECGSPEPPRQ